MQTITPITAPQPEGIIVTTALTAGRIITNHSDGLVVRGSVESHARTGCRDAQQGETGCCRLADPAAVRAKATRAQLMASVNTRIARIEDILLAPHSSSAVPSPARRRSFTRHLFSIAIAPNFERGGGRSRRVDIETGDTGGSKMRIAGREHEDAGIEVLV